MNEAQRILREYERREREIPADFYALHRRVNLFQRHNQEEALSWGLDRAGLLPLGPRRVLDVGCGVGDWLGIWEKFGGELERVAGIELGEARAETARRRYPQVDVRVGDGAALPWDDGAFDVVYQNTVFTSVLDDDVRQAVAREMVRVLAPEGVILWIDFRYDNPRNKQVRAVRKDELRRLFPGCRMELRKIVLAPPIARFLVPRSWRSARLLEMTTLFNTHYLGLIRRK